MQNICNNLIKFVFPAAPEDPGYEVAVRQDKLLDISAQKRIAQNWSPSPRESQ